MSQEILYTSAPKGLKLGSRGFCTVVSTAGMSKSLAERLESLSGYRHVFPPQSAEASLNPVAYSCVTTQVSGMTLYVVSRVSDAGIDYSGRTNKLAHHLALTAAELPPAGPAWLAAQPGVLQTTFTGEPRLLPQGRAIPKGNVAPKVCTAWQQATGDAGWAGVLAHTIAEGPRREASLVFRPGMELLPLIEEAQALLPAELRWQATFSTYFTKLPPGVTCRWRCVLEGSEEAIAARRSPHVLVIDLCQPLGLAPASPHVDAARAGTTLRFAATPGNPSVLTTSDETHAAPASPESYLLEPAPPQLPPTVPPPIAPPPRTGEPISFRRHPPRPRRYTVLWGLLLGSLLGAGGMGAMLYWTKPEVPMAVNEKGVEPTQTGKEKDSPQATESDETTVANVPTNYPAPEPSGDDALPAEPNAASASTQENPAPSTGNATPAGTIAPRNTPPEDDQSPMTQDDPSTESNTAAEEKNTSEPEKSNSSPPPRIAPFAELAWGHELPVVGGSSLGSVPYESLTINARPQDIQLLLLPLFSADAKSSAYTLKEPREENDAFVWDVAASAAPDSVLGRFRMTPSPDSPDQCKLSFKWEQGSETIEKALATMVLIMSHKKTPQRASIPLYKVYFDQKQNQPKNKRKLLITVDKPDAMSIPEDELPKVPGVEYSLQVDHWNATPVFEIKEKKVTSQKTILIFATYQEPKKELPKRLTLQHEVHLTFPNGTLNVQSRTVVVEHHNDSKSVPLADWVRKYNEEGFEAEKDRLKENNPKDAERLKGLRDRRARKDISEKERKDLDIPIAGLAKHLAKQQDRLNYLTFYAQAMDMRKTLKGSIALRIIRYVTLPTSEKIPVTVALIGDYPATQLMEGDR